MAPIRDLQVVVPIDVVSAQLRLAGNGVAAIGKDTRESLGKARCVSPDPPRLVVDAHVVDAEHPARVEVVHRQPRRGGGGIVDRRVLSAIPVRYPDERD